VLRSRGFEPRVLILTLREFERAAANNPFPEADDSPASVHLFFLAEPAKKPDRSALAALKARTERFVLKGKVFHLRRDDAFDEQKAEPNLKG
jgi:uncharacterized protein (DUF1697 family)